MGGRGSGRRWHSGAKDTTNDYRALDVRRSQREGLRVPERAFGWNWLRHDETVASIQVRAESDRVILSYRHRSGGGEWKSEDYPVRLDWTPCTYGESRAWFICPARGCGKRVAILYGGGIFACRHGYRLACPSQREAADDRAARRADRIRARLGAGNSEWFGRETEGDALANLRAAQGGARCSGGNSISGDSPATGASQDETG